MKRRQFLSRMSGIVSGTIIGRKLWWPVTREALAGEATTNPRRLVLIVLQGGNDGLNTVVPTNDPLYYSLRPSIAIPAQQALGVGTGAGLHPSLQPLMPLWNAGKMRLVRDVGYTDMNLSHFRATDIMFSGSSSTQVVQTGWLGRWLEALNPTFPQVLPPDPLALQQGLSASLLLQGDRGVTGVMVDNPSSFYWLVNSNYNGPFNDTPVATNGGDELAFLRQIDRSCFEYATSIQAASDAGVNHVVYPDTDLANQLSVVARLIDGNMNTPVFITAQYGFDTHASQPQAHTRLLSEFAGAVAAFESDLTAMGRAQDVLICTVSEFGRRPGQNGNDGTDHGTSAPWFLIGNGVNGGILGNSPNLASLDTNGNIATQYDYRSIYSTILQTWMGTSAAVTQQVLLGNFPQLPILSTTGVPEDGGPGARVFLSPPMPNPGRGPRTLRFEMDRPGRASLAVFDVAGRLVAPVADRTFEAGRQEIRWNPGDMPAGMYLLVLEASGRRLSEKMIVQ